MVRNQKRGCLEVGGKGRGRPTDYSPEACDQVILLMSQGLSLTASAGAMGICRATIHRWIDAHPEFRDSVARAKAMRVFELETELLSSEDAAFINARRFALVNAAPAEWREKQAVDVDVPADSPIRLLAQQLMGTAIRPQHPAGVIIGHDPTEMVTVAAPVERGNVTTTIPVTTNDERGEDDAATSSHHLMPVGPLLSCNSRHCSRAKA